MRYLSAAERELLLGFGKDHTLFAVAANEVKGNETEFEDKRLSLCGDSFSMLSFWLDHITVVPEMGDAKIAPATGGSLWARFWGAGWPQTCLRRSLNDPDMVALTSSLQSSSRLVCPLISACQSHRVGRLGGNGDPIFF